MMKAKWLGTTLLLIGLAGCAAKPQDVIIGKWQNTDAKGRFQSLEFDKDGTSRHSPVGFKGVLVPGKYKWIGDDQVDLEYTLPLLNVIKSERFKVAVKGDDLAATDENGTKQEFKRIK